MYTKKNYTHTAQHTFGAHFTVECVGILSLFASMISMVLNYLLELTTYSFPIKCTDKYGIPNALFISKSVLYFRAMHVYMSCRCKFWILKFIENMFATAFIANNYTLLFSVWSVNSSRISKIFTLFSESMMVWACNKNIDYHRFIKSIW